MTLIRPALRGIAYILPGVLPVACHPPGEPHVCSTSTGGAAVAGAFDDLFTASGPGWTGGGNATSVALPDGRTVWIFGDTYLGTVAPDRSRAPTTPRVANSLVVQDGDELTTLHGGTTQEPRAMFVPNEPRLTHSPLHGIVDGVRLYVFLTAVEHTSGGRRNPVRTDIAVLSLPSLQLERVVEARVDPRVSWGVSMLPHRSHLYIYGVEEVSAEATKYMHVARTRPGALLDVWEFYDGTAWSADYRASARVLRGVASLFSVFRDGDLLLAVSQELPFHPDVNVFGADDPAGPWTSPTTLFCAPQARDLITYNAVAHPQFAGPANSVLVSYMVNSRDPNAVFADADTFRPKFVWIPRR